MPFSHSQVLHLILGQILTLPAACLELGYDDFNGMRTDEDLSFVRTDPRFEASHPASVQHCMAKNKYICPGLAGTV